MSDSLLSVSRRYFSEPLLADKRMPPASPEAEQALLGALMTNNKACEQVSAFLQGKHFSSPLHGQLYEAIIRRVEANKIADAVTLKDEFEHSDLLHEAGGVGYLAQLLGSVISVINAADYGWVIYENWLRRELVNVGTQVVNRAFNTGEERLSAGEQIEVAEQSLFELASGTEGTGDRFIPFVEALKQAIMLAEAAHQHKGISGVATGLRDVDTRLGGLHASDLLILAGRPGMGKSALATKMAFGVASYERQRFLDGTPDKKGKKPKAVILFSLEMSSDQLATRLLAEQSRISGDKIRKGDLSSKDFERFVTAARALEDLPLYIDDTPSITLSTLRTRARRVKRTQGLSLIVVDYLQLVRPAVGVHSASRVLEISQITQGLKAVAKELSVPVLALSQLSRAVENREDKRPQLSDLRESGSIEQDADVVMFIYRDSYYLQQHEPREISYESSEKFLQAVEKWQNSMNKVHNLAELSIAKQRHGPTGKINLFFEAEFTRFADLDIYHDT